MKGLQKLTLTKDQFLETINNGKSIYNRFYSDPTLRTTIYKNKDGVLRRKDPLFESNFDIEDEEFPSEWLVKPSMYYVEGEEVCFYELADCITNWIESNEESIYGELIVKECVNTDFNLKSFFNFRNIYSEIDDAVCDEVSCCGYDNGIEWPKSPEQSLEETLLQAASNWLMKNEVKPHSWHTEDVKEYKISYTVSDQDEMCWSFQ